ncbi:hypothetical protein DRE_03759 [Drechslerella stenobrocha 248]|uniref:Autophagy-related protein 17 n=1 Tax=Drechslerella stenobrocha 248 TaxID=1043628 RepID=W7I3N6_9PEZI|nr:hypothetical protein DRE_03759 [Drechslerella stenobrocha 248]
MSTATPHRNVADLTNWFLNAKRSLTSVTYCTRGNEIINSTRNALIDASIMASRAAFLQSGIKDELKLLQRAKSVMESQREAARKEFKASLGDLDAAGQRLDEILSSLRSTEVETAFSARDKAEQTQRTLYDFVDEDGVENLRSQLRGIIDQIQETDENFESHLEPFTTLIKSVTESLQKLAKSAASAIPNPVAAIAPSLRSMEDHASVMASLLESLARHFDLCSMALKQAESNDAGISSQDRSPEAEEDKADMLAVLEKDAGEVDDVVIEIKERLDEMEATSVLVEQTVRDIGDHYRSILGLLSIMHEGQNSLVNCTIQSKEFVQKQKDNQEVIAERLDELQRLTDHYVLFGDAYDALLVEVGRRIAVQRQKDAIIQDALAKIDMLNEGDLTEREQFRSEYGDYLPSDIWPGLSDPPGAYMIQPTDVWEIPDVKPGVIENAMNRRTAAVSSGDIDFANTAYRSHIKATSRRRIYSDTSILEPNAYDILAEFSRQHHRAGPTEPRSIIPFPRPPRAAKPRQAESPTQEATPVRRKRSPEEVAHSKKLFATITNGLEKGRFDWPATFYLVACAQSIDTLSPRVRSNSIAYLVRQFVMGGRSNEILRLYTEIQNSWLPLEQRELDTILYFKSLLGAFAIKPAPSHAVVTSVLDTFQVAYNNLDTQSHVGHTKSFREKVTPDLLLFLATNLPLLDSLPLIQTHARYIYDRQAGNEILPKLFSGLTTSLLSSHNLAPPSQSLGSQNPRHELNNLYSHLQSFYDAQSKILDDLSEIRRTPAVSTPLARVLLRQAITWEEVLEAKRLLTKSSDPSDIVRFQAEIMRSLHRICEFTSFGGRDSRSMLELVNDLRWLINLRGEPRQRGTFVGVALGTYIRFGAFRAAETLFADLIALGKPCHVPVWYIQDAVRGLRVPVEVRKWARKNMKKRAAGLATKLWQLYFTPIRDSGGAPRLHQGLHQGLVRDLVQLLEFCGSATAIRMVWEDVLKVLPRGKVKRSTVEAVIEALVRVGDVRYAMEVLRSLATDRPQGVTASVVRPFLSAALMPAGRLANSQVPLDEVVRLGIGNSVRWESVAYLHALRREDFGALYYKKTRPEQLWAAAIQNCAVEVSRERLEGAVAADTLEKIEQAFHTETA